MFTPAPNVSVNIYVQNNRYAAVKNGADIAVPKYTDRLPKFLVIGVMKCGTTALANFLQNHPHVKQSLREPNFFNKDENYHRGFGYYSSLFPQPTYRELLYEKSPEYYNSIMAPARVKAMNSTVKVVNIGIKTYLPDSSRDWR